MNKTLTQPRLVNMRFPDKKTLQLEISSAHEWPHAITKFRDRLQAGSILALSGPLGVGKTSCVQALAHSLGIKALTPSPTFALMRTYKLPKAVNRIERLVHVDAYRIEHEQELIVLDLDQELSDGVSLLVLEWPEKVPKFIASHKVILMEISM